MSCAQTSALSVLSHLSCTALLLPSYGVIHFWSKGSGAAKRSKKGGLGPAKPPETRAGTGTKSKTRAGSDRLFLLSAFLRLPVRAASVAWCPSASRCCHFTPCSLCALSLLLLCSQCVPAFLASILTNPLTTTIFFASFASFLPPIPHSSLSRVPVSSLLLLSTPSRHTLANTDRTTHPHTRCQ